MGSMFSGWAVLEMVLDALQNEWNDSVSQSRDSSASMKALRTVVIIAFVFEELRAQQSSIIDSDTGWKQPKALFSKI